MDSVLECQDCGAVIFRNLSPAEVQQIAERPYDFVIRCRSCRQAMEES